eukprot:TRINITY_DN6997_c0_g3_i1.p1 TRINITY_DN6997_c0_g3~~TRINITY_DN6997_c0_g3_i1.p1  ORF type:complete len:371 (+),score=102.19 TRINITY_DN6997_c0_g3_i1:212-1324(+)
MAPRRTAKQKRSSDEDVKELEAKKAKTSTDVRGEKLAAVESALDRSSAIQEKSRQMLRCMVRGSLGAPPSEPWHRYQATVVDMLREALSEAEAQIVCDAEATVADIARCEAEKSACSRRYADAEKERRRRSEVFLAAKGKFCEDNLAMQDAWQKFCTASNARATSDSKARELIELSKALEKAMRDDYPALVDGTFENAAAHLEVLTPLIRRVPLDDSLADAFPVAANKRPEERGGFDKAVLKQLQAEFEKHVETLAADAAKACAHVGELKTEEASAEAVLDETRSRQRKSATALRFLEQEYLEAEQHVGALREGEREAADAMQGAKADSLARERELTGFRSGPLAALESLCSRSSPASAAAPEPRPIPVA